MEKIKKFVKKNQILLIAVCVCIAALTVAFFAGGNRSENKVQTASTASSLSTTTADTEITSVSATEKNTQNPTDSAKSNKDKKDRKNSEDKKNSKDNSQNSNGSAVEKSEKSELSSSNSSSDKKKTSSSSNSSSKPNKKNDVQPTTQDFSLGIASAVTKILLSLNCQRLVMYYFVKIIPFSRLDFLHYFRIKVLVKTEFY